VPYPHFDTQPLLWISFVFHDAVFDCILYCKYKKFGIFERILNFNLYIHVQNCNDTITNPLTSDNYTDSLLFIFLNWAIRNLRSSIPNCCRSSL